MKFLNLKTENQKSTPPSPLFNKEGVPKAGALRVKVVRGFLKTQNLKLDFPLSLRERVRVRVGRLRFPHLPIHLFTGLIFFALLTAALPAWAAVPGTLTYQGKLSNSSGAPVTGTVSMAFAIYGVSTGGTALWSETQGSVNVASGIFTVTLGSVTSIPSTVFSNTDLYLGIKVGADAEMTPRQKINSVPFAIKSGTAESATSGGVPSGFMILGDSSTPPVGYTYTGETVGDNHWNYKAPMSIARYYVAAAAVNGKVYAIGGESQLSSVEEYDPSTDTWTTKVSMPTGRHGLAAVAVNNKIYAIGGRGTGVLSTVEEYNPSTDTWTARNPMSTAREGLAAAVVNNKIYAIGGYGTGYLSTVEEYDPSTDTWAIKTSMPTARGYLAAAAVNNKIYAIGGYVTGNLATVTVEEYDPSTDTWTTKAPMQFARSYFGAAAVNNNIYAIDGTEVIAGLKSVEMYNISENSWSQKSQLLEALNDGHAAVSVNNKIYVVGSGKSTEELNTKTYYVHRKD